MPFASSALYAVDREGLVRSLLVEFGATNVTQRGDEVWCSCPLPFGLHAHGDRNPSFSINTTSLLVNCWVCGGGTIEWFVATCRGVSIGNARGWLAEKGGDDDPEALGALLALIDALYAKPTALPPIPHMNVRVLDPWKMVHPYLTDRGVPEETIVAQQVGYDPDRHRVVIPHWWKGDLVGWQSRRVVDDGTPKYLSTPELPKDRTLYHASESERVVVVESPMSVLRHLHHVPDMTATFGAAVTDRQVRLLARYERVVLWLDNDLAGWSSTESLAERLLPHTTVWVVQSPFVQDPGDLDEAVTEWLLAEEVVPLSVWRKPTELLDAKDIYA